MKSILAAIARVMRAMRATAWRWVQVGGRWIQEMIPGGAPEPVGPSADVVAEVEAAQAEPSARAVDDIGPVKTLARLMWAGVALRPEHMEGITERELDWLRVLDQGMLHTLAVADKEQIDAHMRGRAPIKGMLPFDPAAVEDMKRAQAMPVPTDGRRTLREMLEAEGLRP
ncbi:hypothetical protein [Devosia sp. MC521]|uniref:hypothetical protein n=1 Tax=Devosia sp. MC521 TaxID=2759954 RepID=UPI0015FABBA2|nr:hypothetical protein [Devosia sp. MC521]MBJ6986051.1 hypothetical protein [Devosia sp. MC521]QMW61421.1 hypothetical protein H4N61_10545 [Devosia sp. MC521]